VIDSVAASEQILVVDDETMIRRLLERVVGDTGHVVETAANGTEAREWLEASRFAVVICDLDMPGESGVELARWIRAKHPDVAVLIATGTNDAEVADAALATGAYGYLVKPFKRNEVAINIANALRRRSLEIENRDYRDLLEHRVAERTEELQRSRAELVRRLSMAIEFRSSETGEHVERIGDRAAAIGWTVGLDEDSCDMIRVAAALHDVGKIGIPDEILLKPGPLTAQERSRMQDHAQLGHELLAGSGIEVLDVAATIAFTHHEQFDGSGYPRGLRGNDIPIEGRITAIADVYDALTHDRVYRPALPNEEVAAIMHRGRGTHFDPDLFDAFLTQCA
jgi:putative two-component system response regulator